MLKVGIRQPKGHIERVQVRADGRIVVRIDNCDGLPGFVSRDAVKTYLVDAVSRADFRGEISLCDPERQREQPAGTVKRPS